MAGRILRACDHLPARFNAASWFVGRHAAEGRASRVAIVTDEGETTYGALDIAVRRFAGALRRAGVAGGDRVALVLLDRPVFSVSFWGAIAAGAVAVPLNTQLKPEHLKSILADCAPRLLVFDPEAADSSLAGGAVPAAWTAEEALARSLEVEPLAAYASTHRDDPAFMLFSSGTTGEPKGVVHLQHDMWICCRGFGEHVLGVRPEDRCFSIAKLFFAYGLGNAHYFPFDAGAACVLYPGRPTPAAVFEQVRRHRPTVFFGVPTAYALMLAEMEKGVPADFGSVRACASAGESLPAALWKRWRDRTGLEILDGIGSTETGHCFLSNRPGNVRPGSSGRPVPGYAVRIVEEAGGDVARGAIGDLLVQGDSIMARYWNKPEATRRALSDDWIRTGDKYREDEDGYFWHAGRSDDMLKVGGKWVSPVEVEAALTAHDAVLECAVVGHEDTDGLIKPHAFLRLREGGQAPRLADEIRDFARQRLEAYKCPRWITFVPELPKTATGKIQRFLLRTAAASSPSPSGRGSG